VCQSNACPKVIPFHAVFAAQFIPHITAADRDDVSGGESSLEARYLVSNAVHYRRQFFGQASDEWLAIEWRVPAE
jgi:hypothetical protein